MTYRIKEIFSTVQGEGYFAGRRAVFVRFAGCNYWSGRESDRERGPGPCAVWCDTDFVGGAKMTADEIVRAAEEVDPYRARFVVFTGGEPGLQLDDALLAAFADWYFAVETNGSVRLPDHPRLWVTFSPKFNDVKAHAIRSCDEIKIVLPSVADPVVFEHFPTRPGLRWVSPRDNTPDSIAACLAFIERDPKWRLSIQLHKTIGVR